MTFQKQTVRDVFLEGRTVLVRADYNVPLNDDGSISNDFRIKASLPTLRYLLGQRCRIVIVSHLGRPNGQRDAAFSLRPVAQRLANLLQQEIRFVDDTIGDKVHQTVSMMSNGQIVLLENVRFYEEEKANDQEFARQLAESTQADFFVQDGFGVVHRAHATTSAITLFLPPVAGLLLERECETIQAAIEEPKRPLVAVMGGAKISDKIPIIKRFIEKADNLMIGGAMANNFLLHQGKEMGKSLTEPGQDAVIDEIYSVATEKVGQAKLDQFLQIPTDVAVGKTTEVDEPRRVVSSDEVAEDDIVLDIGDATIQQFEQVLKNAGTVVWNGPVGMSGVPAFAEGSAALAAIISSSSTVSVVGGGDTADFVLEWSDQAESKFSHISTGGGASLELMAGDRLPGIEALLDARR